MREGLRSLIEKEIGMKVAAEATDGRTAVELAKEIRPDVVVMDLTMPGLNGVEATRQIVAECPDVKVLVLSMHSNSPFVTEALHAGASGYLLKDCAFEEMAKAIRVVTAGQVYLSPGIAGTVVDIMRRSAPGSRLSTLTPREREVLQLIAEGRSTKVIASILNLSLKTVESHRHQIMRKLQIYDIAGLTKLAVREGLTTVES
jgi:DNA-binding NarL/FixJ family response regulator